MKITENQIQFFRDGCEVEFEKEYVLQPLSFENIENVSNLNRNVSEFCQTENKNYTKRSDVFQKNEICGEQKPSKGEVLDNSQKNLSEKSQKVSEKVNLTVEGIRKKYKKLGDTDKFVKTNETRRAILREADSLRWAELVLTVFPYLPAIAESLEKNYRPNRFFGLFKNESIWRNNGVYAEYG